jgi:glycosyltransferase involved in cell wall biosynthesis
LKVLFINTYHYRRAGAEVHALDLAEQLRHRGHEIRFFSMSHPENLESTDSEYWVPEIDYRSMNASKNPVNAVRVLSRAIYSVDVRKSLARMLSDWQPDVAHLHNLHAHLTPAVVDALKSAGVPAVWTLHDYKLLCPNTTFVSHDELCERCKGERFWQCTVRRCKKDSLSASLVASWEAEAHRFLHLPARVDRFIAPSDFLRQKFIEFGWPAEKFIHMPNFNNRPLVSQVTRPAERRVLYSGHLVRVKGILTLLDAISPMSGVRLDIAGEGPLRGDIEAMLANRSSGGADIRLHGWVSADVLENLIDSARLIVVPSEWYENSPYAVIEAFARARPVVASRIGGLPELVVDGTSGITIDPGTPHQLAEATAQLLDDFGLWHRLARGALAAASVRGASEYVAGIEALYAQVTGEAT